MAALVVGTRVSEALGYDSTLQTFGAKVPSVFLAAQLRGRFGTVVSKGESYHLVLWDTGEEECVSEIRLVCHPGTF